MLFLSLSFLFSIPNAQGADIDCDLRQFPNKYESAIGNFAKTAPRDALKALIAINKAKLDFDMAVKNCVAAKNIQFDQLADAFDFQFLLAVMIDLKTDNSGKLSLDSCEDAKSLVQQQGVFPHYEDIKNSKPETKVLGVLSKVCRR